MVAGRPYAFELTYYQGTGGKSLGVYWMPPGESTYQVLRASPVQWHLAPSSSSSCDFGTNANKQQCEAVSAALAGQARRHTCATGPL